ncbi:rhodanese-like domain-containing protein [Formosa sediminum]|uniref:Rhodanese-like domain-containing protein n=1 Tax=Formosa sediminum TaxID=2594004 RepID=A0A516GMG5_9FLAO|nr:rhodanese-like domain-containing protein [Formosa sediminum]QDO92665.1 rhodanese-like domain-containing protein [Formosa sediminum]
MKKINILYGFLVLLFMACTSHETGVIEVVSAEEMQSLISLDDVQLVDLRSEEDRFKQGYIANSQHIDYSSETFEEDIKNLDKSKPVALYCNSGKRSAECAQKLKEAGFVKIFDLQGGVSEWKHKGNILIKD